MTKGGFSRLLGPPVRHSATKKIKGKDFEQVKAFASIIDRKIDDFLKVLTRDKNNRKKQRV